MAALIILFICLLFQFAIALKNAEIIFVPQVGFISGFLLQLLFCFFYINEWEINLSRTTIWIIIMGSTTFLVVSLLSRKTKVKNGKVTIQRQRFDSSNESTLTIEQSDSVSSLVLIIFILLQLFALIWYVYFMMTKMQGAGLAAKIYYYRQQTADYGKAIHVPKALSFLRLLSGAIGYVCSYLLAKQIVGKLPGKRLLFLANIIISFAVEGILGARGGMFNFLIAIITEFMIVRYQSTQKKPNLKSLLRFVVIGLCVLLFFPTVGAIIGRPDLGPVNEMAMYIGAPLKNLDILVISSISDTGFHASTFSSILSDLKRFIPIINLDNNMLPSRWNYVHGHNLGNVYTTFSNFWYDLRIGGVVLYSAVMALISQWLYKKAIFIDYNHEVKSAFCIIIYSYFFSSVLFSFFANRFFSQFFSLFAIKFAIAVYTVLWVTRHFKTKMGRYF